MSSRIEPTRRFSVFAAEPHNERRASRASGASLAQRADRVVRAVGSARDIDVVTWTPAPGPVVARHGLDPGEALARAVAARLDRPCRRLLERSRRFSPQASVEPGRARARYQAKFQWRPRRVLVIADHLEHPEAAEQAAQVLVEAGAAEVRWLRPAA